MAGNTSWMKARQTKFAAYTAVYVVIVLAVVHAFRPDHQDRQESEAGR